MRVSYEWLNDFIDLVDVTPQQAAEMLTMSGVEIASLTVIDVRGILVGRVISQDPHPKSRNPLWIHQVDIGRGDPQQIIAGAPNAGPGSLVPVALPGTTVPNGRTVRDINIAGFAARGMLCSQQELLLGDDHSGIMVLESGRPGQDLSEIFPPDAILDAEVTSNRPDCLSHMGIARELGALLKRPLKRDFMPLFTGGVEPPGSELIDVRIDDPELCRRYIGAVVKGVEVSASPLWMRRRLRAAGLRPINNVVDVTNYVLLEYGQPLHAFDLANLSGPAIRVRRATAGERITTLDGEERQLTAEMLVIADAERAQAVAGVIGGLGSEVSSRTTEVLIEAACFDGKSIRATARALGIRTEASSRFEKGLPPELALAGARRAAQLLAEVAGGRVHIGWPDVYPRPQEPVRIQLQPEQIDARLGIHVPLEESEQILRRLDFQVRVQDDGSWDVLAPVFRLDVSIPEDLSEEIGRIHGYDKIPATLPGARAGSWRIPEPSLESILDGVRQVLAGGGLTETLNPALVPLRQLERLGIAGRAMVVDNAISEELNALRTSLLASLLEVASVNRSRPRAGAFEIAAVYWRNLEDPERQPQEPLHLGAVLVAGSDPAGGRGAVLEMKSLLDAVGRQLGVSALEYRRGADQLFHPGRTSSVFAGGQEIGLLGEVHPTIGSLFELDVRVVAMEIDVQALIAAGGPLAIRTPPRFPAVDRDLAVVVSVEVEAARLLAAIGAAGGELLVAASAFDEYRGAQLGEGLKSVAFALTFRSPERTLTDAEVDALVAQVRTSLQAAFDAGFRA